MERTIEDIMGVAPNSFEEAVERAIDLLIEFESDILKCENADDFVCKLHHGLGQHIRNYWGLWQKNSGLYTELNEKYKLDHADDLSSLVLKAAYQQHNDLPIDLDEDVKAYHKHWELYE